MKILILNLVLLVSASVFAQDISPFRLDLPATTIGGPRNYAKAIYPENPCSKDLVSKASDKKGKRRKFAIRLKGINVAVGASYVGVTSEGDIATVYNDGKGPIMVADICYRDSVNKEYGQLIGNLIINNSLNCQVDEITQAQIVLPSKEGSLYLLFRPIYFTGSSLCAGSYGSEVLKTERNETKELEENKDNIDSNSNVNKN